MKSLRNVIEELVQDKDFSNKLENVKTISDLYDMCKQVGYTNSIEEFETDFEKLLKEEGLSELNNEQLMNVSGGVVKDFKKFPSLALAVLSLGGGFSSSGFAMDSTNNEISSSNVAKNVQVPVEENKDSDKLNKLRDKALEIKDSALKKGKEVAKKGVELVKENPVESVSAGVIATGLLGAGIYATKTLINASSLDNRIAKLEEELKKDKAELKSIELKSIELKSIEQKSIEQKSNKLTKEKNKTNLDELTNKIAKLRETINKKEQELKELQTKKEDKDKEKSKSGSDSGSSSGLGLEYFIEGNLESESSTKSSKVFTTQEDEGSKSGSESSSSSGSSSTSSSSSSSEEEIKSLDTSISAINTVPIQQMEPISNSIQMNIIPKSQVNQSKLSSFQIRSNLSECHRGVKDNLKKWFESYIKTSEHKEEREKSKKTNDEYVGVDTWNKMYAGRYEMIMGKNLNRADKTKAIITMILEGMFVDYIANNQFNGGASGFSENYWKGIGTKINLTGVKKLVEYVMVDKDRYTVIGSVIKTYMGLE